MTLKRIVPVLMLTLGIISLMFMVGYFLALYDIHNDYTSPLI